MSYSISRSSRNPSKYVVVRSDNMESAAEFNFNEGAKKYRNASKIRKWVKREVKKSSYVRHDLGQTIAEQQYAAYARN